MKMCLIRRIVERFGRLVKVDNMRSADVAK